MFAAFLAEQGREGLPGFSLDPVPDYVESRVGTAHLVRTFLELKQMHGLGCFVSWC